MRFRRSRVTVQDINRVGLRAVEGRLVICRNGARIDQRNSRVQAASSRNGNVLAFIPETETEGQIRLGITVVVDVNVVDGVVVECEIVGAAAWILQGIVVRQQGHVAGPVGFIAHEHVEVGGVHRRLAGDERRFAVTGCHCHGGQQAQHHC